MGEVELTGASAPLNGEAPASSPGDLPDLATRPIPLRELQALARRRSPRQLALRARLAAAEARTRQSLATFLPWLSTRSEYIRYDDQIEFDDPLGGGSFIAQDDEVFSQSTTASWLLWDFGGREATYRASRAEEIGEQANVERDLQRLDREVAEAYLAWAEARQEVAVLEASVDALAGSLSLARDLESVGRAMRSDVLVVEVELERTRHDARKLADTASDAREELTLLLSLPPEATLVLPETPAAAPLLDLAESAARTVHAAIALERRAELRALESRRRALVHGLEAERSKYWPRFDVFVRHEYSTTESDLLEPNVVSGGVTAEWQVFNGFSTRNRVLEIEAQLRELAAQGELLRASIVREVRQALRRAQRAAEGIAVAAKGIERAEENLRQLTDRFREGRAGGQELLEAETLLRSERARGVEARFTLERAIAALRFALGLDVDEELPVGE